MCCRRRTIGKNWRITVYISEPGCQQLHRNGIDVLIGPVVETFKLLVCNLILPGRASSYIAAVNEMVSDVSH